MSNHTSSTEPAAHLLRENYAVDSLEDELRVNKLCKQLLRDFHQYLLDELQLDPLDAGGQAAGADYFLLDFMIDSQRANIFDGSALYLKKFAANWYIISNLTPNSEELQLMLAGTANFYRYCAKLQLVAAETAEQIAAATRQIDFYQQRIENFLDITGDGFVAWNQQCPLK